MCTLIHSKVIISVDPSVFLLFMVIGTEMYYRQHVKYLHNIVLLQNIFVLKAIFINNW